MVGSDKKKKDTEEKPGVRVRCRDVTVEDRFLSSLVPGPPHLRSVVPPSATERDVEGSLGPL